MKTLHSIVVVALLASSEPLFAAVAPPPPRELKQSAPNPLSSRFKQVRERINSLYEHRSEAPPPFDPRSNPFRAPGVPVTSTPASTDGIQAPPPSPVSNLTLLQQAAATLKVSGVVERAGQSHLVINARPYKQGDVVQTIVQGETVYVRLKEISKRTVTFVLNDAEMTLKF